MQIHPAVNLLEFGLHVWANDRHEYRWKCPIVKLLLVYLAQFFSGEQDSGYPIEGLLTWCFYSCHCPRIHSLTDQKTDQDLVHDNYSSIFALKNAVHWYQETITGDLLFHLKENQGHHGPDGLPRP